MDYFLAFLVGGIICMIGQLLLDVWKLSLTHVMSIFVVIGTILAGFGLYDNLIQLAGAGATVPISSFGYSIFIGAMKQAQESKGIGIGMGVFNLTSAGITASILFSFIVALFFKPKG